MIAQDERRRPARRASASIAARVAASPRASAGTDADGSRIENAATAARTSTSIADSSAAAAAGAGRRIALNKPGIDVSMPSKKLFSFGPAKAGHYREVAW